MTKKKSSASKVVVHGNTIFYYDQYGRPHKDDGPAVTVDDVTGTFYKHGKLHNLKGPAINGEEPVWYVNNIRIESWEQFSYESGIQMEEVFKIALLCDNPPKKFTP